MGAEFQVAQDALFEAEVPNADIIITTALIPGRPAPKIIKEDMVKSMKPGSVIVDLAAPTGGNAWATVDGQKAGFEICHVFRFLIRPDEQLSGEKLFFIVLLDFFDRFIHEFGSEEYLSFDSFKLN